MESWVSRHMGTYFGMHSAFPHLEADRYVLQSLKGCYAHFMSLDDSQNIHYSASYLLQSIIGFVFTSCICVLLYTYIQYLSTGFFYFLSSYSLHACIHIMHTY